MPIVTDVQTISNTISNIIDFVSTNEKVKTDFEEYIQTIGATNITPQQMQVLSIPYITERILYKQEGKTVPELYLQEAENISDLEKEIVLGLNNTISSVFEIKKRLRNSFEMYNLVNEKTYTAIPLVKMTQLSEIFPDQFALVRIFKFKNDYFILEISDVIPSYEKDTAMNFAVAKIIEKPEDLYFDNEEKFNEVKNYVEKSIKGFKTFFGTNEILTTNKKIDGLVDLFDSYLESGNEELKDNIIKFIDNVEIFKYFNVREFSNSYDTFLQKSMEGFSSHNETYDVGYMCDEKSGIYIIPFWGTLCKIFTSDNYKEIENFKECVEEFIKNDKIPPSIIEKLAYKTKSTEFFEKRLQEITGENISVIDTIKKYKSEYMKKIIFSSANVLYCSKTFAEIVKVQ